MQVDVGNCVGTEEGFWWSETAILFALKQIYALDLAATHSARIPSFLSKEVTNWWLNDF